MKNGSPIKTRATAGKKRVIDLMLMARVRTGAPVSAIVVMTTSSRVCLR